eukprot:TRINITY_DN70809_c0_g1_i1.p1 TRINITY_DN70809_c0_g1~~TRINITY_DN70809_c0_g1_i1.p1  ORF type:complete len:679 (-),score=115.80 TRINITY_DN70809_c0_g1_i1:162-2198(-)
MPPGTSGGAAAPCGRHGKNTSAGPAASAGQGVIVLNGSTSGSGLELVAAQNRAPAFTGSSRDTKSGGPRSSGPKATKASSPATQLAGLVDTSSAASTAAVAASGTAIETVGEPCTTNGGAPTPEGEDDQETQRLKAQQLEIALLMLKFVVPAKNILSCYLLGPVVLGECRTERLCMPGVNALLLVLDVFVFTGHLVLGMNRHAYREHVVTYNFYIISVFWSVWNLCSHPLCRQHVVDLFVAPPEVHVTINVVAIAVCSSTLMAPPSMRHLIGLVTWQFLISLVLSTVEVMNFSMDTGWLAVVRLDIVMFNIAILLIGSTIIFGTMTVEKDIKNLAHEMEHRLGPSGSFEDDLERRKRAVLTALCDAVLTTNATFAITESDDGGDRIFRRPMLNEQMTDYFKDEAEKERFWAAVKKQFPEDDTVGEGPKRMRVTLRDGNDELFDADVVVSDASTDKHGKVNKYMVGMHMRGEFRSRALDDSKQRSRSGAGNPDKRLTVFAETTAPTGCGNGLGVGGGSEKPGGLGESRVGSDGRRLGGAKPYSGALAWDKSAGEERTQQQMYEELTGELFAAFEGVLRLPGGGLPNGRSDIKIRGDSGGDVNSSGAEVGTPVVGNGGGGSGRSSSSLRDPTASCTPRFHLRRATCEVFRRRTPPLASRTGERHVDLRRLSLPEPAGGLT